MTEIFYVLLGEDGYRNKNQHRRLTLEKRIVPPLLPELEPETFRSRVRRSTTDPSRLPGDTSAKTTFRMGNWLTIVIRMDGQLSAWSRGQFAVAFVFALLLNFHVFRKSLIHDCRVCSDKGDFWADLQCPRWLGGFLADRRLWETGQRRVQTSSNWGKLYSRVALWKTVSLCLHHSVFCCLLLFCSCSYGVLGQ